MSHKVPVAACDETVGVGVLEIYACRPIQVLIEFQESIAQPVECDVGCQYGTYIALFVLQRQRIGNHGDIAAFLTEIRLAPVWFACLYGYLVPVLFQVVIGVVDQQFCLDFTGGRTVGIGCEAFSHFGIEVWREGYRCSHDFRIFANDVFGNDVHPVGVDDIPFHGGR